MKKNDATVSSLDWITYSSYVDGPCWMKYVADNKFLDELSIPGTHDSGTCSVDNDTGAPILASKMPAGLHSHAVARGNPLF